MNERPYQVAWWDDPNTSFELRTPWWATARRTLNLGDNHFTYQYGITAAVMAISPEDAKQQIVQAYAREVELEWHSVEVQPYGWTPVTKERPLQPGQIWDQRPH